MLTERDLQRQSRFFATRANQLGRLSRSIPWELLGEPEQALMRLRYPHRPEDRQQALRAQADLRLRAKLFGWRLTASQDRVLRNIEADVRAYH